LGASSFQRDRGFRRANRRPWLQRFDHEARIQRKMDLQREATPRSCFDVDAAPVGSEALAHAAQSVAGGGSLGAAAVIARLQAHHAAVLLVAQLQLAGKRVFWDIGFCTGSVAIEARCLFPHLRVVAFEKRPECEALIETNARRLSAPGLEVVMGDFFALDLAARPAPDAVFIGGHGNRLPELLTLLDAHLPAGATIVLNAVLERSHAQFVAQVPALGWQLLPPERIQLDQHNPIWVLTATKL